MQPNRSFVGIMTEIVTQCAAHAHRRRHEKFRVHAKGLPRDFYTDVDAEVSRIGRSLMEQLAPGVAICSEEGDNPEGKVFEWEFVFDEIDGSANFLTLADGNYAISLGLLHNGKPYAGVIAMPELDLLLVAEVGVGCTIKERGVSRQVTIEPANAKLSEVPVGVIVNYAATPEERVLSQRLCDEGRYVVATGANVASLIQCLNGTTAVFGAFISFKWDLAAAAAAFDAAGGYYCTLTGETPKWTENRMHLIFAQSKELAAMVVAKLAEPTQLLLESPARGRK